MRKTGAALAATMLLGLCGPIGLGAAAHAGVGGVVDGVGDAGRGGLDVTAVSLDNGEARAVTRVEVVRSLPGRVVVSLETRRGRGVILVATRKRDGSVKKRVVAGTFETAEEPLEDVRCRGFRVRWTSNVVRLSLPDRCLNGGRYAALRFTVLTEKLGASDADLAPDPERDQLGFSPWIRRD